MLHTRVYIFFPHVALFHTAFYIHSSDKRNMATFFRHYLCAVLVCKLGIDRFRDRIFANDLVGRRMNAVTIMILSWHYD